MPHVALGFLFLDGNITRLLLRKRSLRQKAAAELIGISAAQFSKALDGKRPIRLAVFVALCHLLKSNDPEVLVQHEEPANAS